MNKNLKRVIKAVTPPILISVAKMLPRTFARYAGGGTFSCSNNRQCMLLKMHTLRKLLPAG